MSVPGWGGQRQVAFGSPRMMVYPNSQSYYLTPENSRQYPQSQALSHGVAGLEALGRSPAPYAASTWEKADAHLGGIITRRTDEAANTMTRMRGWGGRRKQRKQRKSRTVSKKGSKGRKTRRSQ
jgi:hypothetical protein